MITYCPRTDAIKRLNTLIQDLQTKNQAIILMVDANQSLAECSISTGIKPHSIEWLRLQMGMDGPFIQLMGRHPNSMTQTPNRDIDFILTYGINITNISTLAPNIPSHSDHLGLVFDIDLHSFFSSTYSDIYKIPPRCLTSGNKSSIDKYITYISEQINTHKIPQRIQSLLTKADQPTPSFESVDKHLLNSIYTQVTEILLAGERLCSRKTTQWQPWSPLQREIARTYSYWRQKLIMSAKNLFRWDHLEPLQRHTSILDEDHAVRDYQLIETNLKRVRDRWRACKKKSTAIRKKSLKKGPLSSLPNSNVPKKRRYAQF